MRPRTLDAVSQAIAAQATLRPLVPGEYAARWRALLQLEEAQMAFDMRQYDVHSAVLERTPTRAYSPRHQIATQR